MTLQTSTPTVEELGNLKKPDGTYMVPLDLVRKYYEIAKDGQEIIERSRVAVSDYLRAPSVESNTKLEAISTEIVNIITVILKQVAEVQTAKRIN